MFMSLILVLFLKRLKINKIVILAQICDTPNLSCKPKVPKTSVYKKSVVVCH